MVRKQINSGGNAESAEINLIVLQMKGDSAVLAKSIDALIHTLQKPSGQALRAMTPNPPAVLSAQSPERVVDDGARGAQPEVVFPESDGEEPSAPRAAESKPPKARAFSPVEPLDTLNVNDAPDPFRDFVGARSISGMNERGLVAATWVRDRRATKQFGIRHLATCFRAMGWKLPDDQASLLRNMKKANLVKNAAPGLFELTTVGENKYAEIT